MIKKQNILLIVILLFFAAVSCKNEAKEEQKKSLARVYDRYLYIEEIESILPENLSKTDSITFVKNYIDKWIKKELMRKVSDENLPENEKNVEKLIDDYRTSLLIYRYEQQIIKERMKPDVTRQEVENYYEKNTDEFIMTKNALIPLYVKVPLDAQDIAKVRKLCRLENESDLEDLDEYCTENATEFYFNEEWVYFTDLLKKIPIETDNQEQFLKYTKNYETKDSAYYYFLNVRENRIKGEVSPLSFVYDKIVAIILTKRKIELIDKFEKAIYNENKENIEIFEK
ncbi:MAG: hypothetical protein A2W91_11195 [Bacteroidetes bacterium GWF2_38_335]|nr:MAG: hypothetical protein A2W91_11195 [Bacteroidetes bacterium GWF2_38_335]OFY81737.1 MAG: hypothetical protein A2281_05845 [Bacteroidetes bacterium RIFOXYA12_FULL_38_20]HBS87802.1 hypothetical protein [Bacteroidales bacterium]